MLIPLAVVQGFKFRAFTRFRLLTVAYVLPTAQTSQGCLHWVGLSRSHLLTLAEGLPAVKP